MNTIIITLLIAVLGLQTYILYAIKSNRQRQMDNKAALIKYLDSRFLVIQGEIASISSNVGYIYEKLYPKDDDGQGFRIAIAPKFDFTNPNTDDTHITVDYVKFPSKDVYNRFCESVVDKLIKDNFEHKRIV